MIAIDDIDVIAPERLLGRKPQLLSNEFSFPVYKGVKKDIEIIKQLEEREEFPIEKWIIPPQPERYFKCNNYDFF